MWLVRALKRLELQIILVICITGSVITLTLHGHPRIHFDYIWPFAVASIVFAAMATLCIDALPIQPIKDLKFGIGAICVGIALFYINLRVEGGMISAIGVGILVLSLVKYTTTLDDVRPNNYGLLLMSLYMVGTIVNSSFGDLSLHVIFMMGISVTCWCVCYRVVTVTSRRVS